MEAVVTTLTKKSPSNHRGRGTSTHRALCQVRLRITPQIHRAGCQPLPLIFTPRSVHHAEDFHVVRPGAVFSSLHVAVGASGIWRVDATALFAKLGGATSRYPFCLHDVGDR